MPVNVESDNEITKWQGKGVLQVCVGTIEYITTVIGYPVHVKTMCIG